VYSNMSMPSLGLNPTETHLGPATSRTAFLASKRATKPGSPNHGGARNVILTFVSSAASNTQRSMLKN
jgi:hypothetical protein